MIVKEPLFDIIRPETDYSIRNGDCLNVLKKIDDGKFEGCVFVKDDLKMLRITRISTKKPFIKKEKGFGIIPNISYKIQF